jgi:predicted DNA-binding protein (MmcQ/YjbR family)
VPASPLVEVASPASRHNVSMPRKADVQQTLLRFALSYPESREDHPWGETVVKVNKKVFVFLGRPEHGGIGLSVKLPQSNLLALDLPFASPTGYGLGKSGWVTAQFTPKQKPPIELLKQWIDESYRAVAPKTLVAKLDGDTSARIRGKRPKAAN